MDQFIFKREPKDYKLTMVPTKNYHKQITKYISKQTGYDNVGSTKILKYIIAAAKDKKNPIVTYRHRDDKGDREMTTTTLTDYIKTAIDNNEVITPTFTTLDHPSKKKSLHSQYMNKNVKLRSADKHAAFKYKQLGDKDNFLKYNTLQKVRKIFNNSLSGAYGANGTILSNPAAHSILATITRCVASIGNSISESIIAGNRHFRTVDTPFNYITSVITHIDMTLIEYITDRYNLHIPTVDEVFAMIVKCSEPYWKDEEVYEEIKDYLNKLTDTELTAVLYVNDLHHLRIYNEDIVKDLLTGMSTKVSKKFEDPLKVVNESPEGIMNLVHHICSKDIQGKVINYKEMIGTELMDLLTGTANQVNKTLLRYKGFIKAFFTTDILPIDIANIKEMLREAITLSDTDSTCGSYDKWVEWYYGHDRYTPEAIGLSAAVMTINTQAMDHNIKVFAKNMNIDNNLVELLKMKNEFFWSSFITANVSKHYYADTWIQEGNVFPEPDLELKGVHFISSSGSMEITKEAHQMMKTINKLATAGYPIDPYIFIQQVVNAELKLIKKIKEGDITIFKTEKIKEHNSYKSKIKEKTPYYHHMFWKAVFSNKYGSPGEPEYMCIKIPTILNKKAVIKDWLTNLEDREIAENVVHMCTKYNKDKLGVIRAPLAVVGSKGIPTELTNVIDIKRTIGDSLNVMYMMLETIGIYKKPGYLLSEQYNF